VYWAVLSNFFKTRICAVLGLFVGRPSALVRLLGKLNSNMAIYKIEFYFYEIETKIRMLFEQTNLLLFHD
jgi:hypothetical protein